VALSSLDVLFLNDPELVRQVLTVPKLFPKGEVQTSFLVPLLGEVNKNKIYFTFDRLSYVLMENGGKGNEAS
jgi:hypothetical protein